MLKAPSKAASPIKRLLKQLKKLPIPSYEYFKENDEMYHSYGGQFTTIKTYEEIVSFFRQLLDKEIFPSPRLLSKFINRLINISGTYEDIQEIYDFALNRGLANVAVVNAMIDAVGKNQDLDFAIKIYQNAKDRNLQLNLITYSSLINVAGKNGNLLVAKKIFQEAKTLKPTLSLACYSSMIDAAGRNGDLEYAKAVFQEAKDRGKLNDIIYNALMHAAGINGDLIYIKKKHQEFRQQDNIILDAVYYGTLMNAASKVKDYDFVKFIYQEAQNNNIPLNDINCSILINAAIAHADFAFLKLLWQEIQNSQIRICDISYVLLVAELLRYKDFTLAMEVIESAQYYQIAFNRAQYTHLIDTAIGAGASTLAETLFAMAIRSKIRLDVLRYLDLMKLAFPQAFVWLAEPNVGDSQEAYEERAPDTFPTTQATLEEDHGQSIETAIDTTTRESYTEKQTPCPPPSEQKLSISTQLKEPSSEPAEAGIKTTQNTDSEERTPSLPCSPAHPTASPEKIPKQTIFPQQAARPEKASIHEPSIFSSETSHSNTKRRKRGKRKSGSLFQLTITPSQSKMHEPLDLQQYARDLINAWLKEEQVNPQDKEQAIKTLATALELHALKSKLDANQKSAIKTLLLASLYHGIWDQLFCRTPYRINCTSSAFSIEQLAGLFGNTVSPSLSTT